MPHTKINSGWIADLKVFKRKYMYTFQNAEEVNDFLSKTQIFLNRKNI